MSVKKHALLHLSARLGSVFLSLGLFAWLGRTLPDSEAARTYAFMFAFGFIIATGRMALQLGASIRADQTGSMRLRSALKGLHLLWRMLPILAGASIYVTWTHTGSLLLAACAALMVCAAALDVDLPRSALGKSSLFSTAFLVGTALTLIAVQFVRPTSAPAAVWLLLLQWLPVVILNLRVWRFHLKAVRARTTTPGMVPTMLLSSFDGAIINAPYIGLLSFPTSALLETSLATRVFVASLPMLPLLMHWTNSSSFTRISRHLKTSNEKAFFALTLVSGLPAGSIFMLALSALSGRDISFSTIAIYMAMLASYAFYATQARFSNAGKFSPFSALGLTLLVLTTMATLFGLSIVPEQAGAIAIAAVQCLALVLGGLLIRIQSSRSNFK